MKIVEPYGHEPTNDSMRKQRMEALLSAWQRRARWLPTEAARAASPPPDTTLTVDEWTIWLEILRAAEPVPPRTHINGLETHAALRGLAVEDLKAQGVVRVIGPRVSTRWIRGPRPEAARLGGHSWALRVRPGLVGRDPNTCEQILKKRFREVSTHGDILLAFTPWRGFPETAVALVGHALAESTGAVLDRLWRLARALEVDDAFLDQLPDAERKTLAGTLQDELHNSLEHLDVRTDATLEFFAEGHADALPEDWLPEMHFPTSRLASLLQAEDFLEHLHREIGDHYFDDLAAAFVAVAAPYPLGEFLKRLLPGRALLAAVEELARARPELIATYVWHPAFHAEGAFALLQLPQQMLLAHGRSLSLTDEWLEVQRLGREQLVRADRSDDWMNVLTLGIRDESVVLAHRHYGRSESLLQQTPYQDAGLWRAVIAEPEKAQLFVDLLDGYFHAATKRGEGVLVFALQLFSPLRDGEQRELAKQLARAIVDGYAAALSLDSKLLSIPDVLGAYGALLEDLRIALDEASQPDGYWSKWLRPFDVADYLKQGLTSDSGRVDSRIVNPRLDVPRILRAHAEALVAHASASMAHCEASLDAALDLYIADQRAGLSLGAFSWSALAQTTASRSLAGSEPIFVRLGRVIGRMTGGSEMLARLLAEKPPAHVLAYLLVDLDEGHPLRERIQPPLREGLNKLLSRDTGFALGHALELASTLHQARMGRDAERCARRVLVITKRFQPHDGRPYDDAANAILVGALAQQELWAEILAFEQDVETPRQRLFVSNMRAVALMETKSYEEAERVLDDVLAAEPNNRVALINRSALYLRKEDWKKAIEAVKVAKTVVPADAWDGLIINEAVAREKLGDTFGALAALDVATSTGGARPDVSAMREHLQNGGSPPVVAAREDVSLEYVTSGPASNAALSREVVRAPAEPDDAVDIAIITALPEEYYAVCSRLTGCKPVPPDNSQHKNLYAWAIGSIPAASGKGAHRIVVALAGQSGNLKTFGATLRTIDRWRPTFVLFSGIAGGLTKDDLAQGDVVLARTIWFYEHGKVVDGAYHPRHRDTFPAHTGLLNSAQAFQVSTKDWQACNEVAPMTGHTPKCVPGTIGSGEKVVDDLEPAFVQAILKARPELQAIEMEAAGAAHAIELARDEGQSVGFLMVRGVSDMPAAGGDGAVDADAAGTKERDNWKPYASAIAAHFIASWVASPWWLSAPRT